MTVTNNDQAKMIKKVTDVLAKILARADSVKQFTTEVPIEWFIARSVQESYDIFHIIRSELVKRGVQVAKTHIVGPLLSRRSILKI